MQQIEIQSYDPYSAICPCISIFFVHIIQFKYNQSTLCPASVFWTLPGLTGGHPHRLHHLQRCANTHRFHRPHHLLFLFHLWGGKLWQSCGLSQWNHQAGSYCGDQHWGGRGWWRGAAGGWRKGGMGRRGEGEEEESFRAIREPWRRERWYCCCWTQH